MRFAVGASGVLLLALAAAGCASSSTNDHDAIEQLWKGYFSAFETGNASKAASYYVDSCTDVEETLATIFGASKQILDQTDVEVTDIALRNRTADEAEAAPIGQIVTAGSAEPMQGDGFVRVVKENGKWKFADCLTIGGLPFESATP